VHDKSTSIALGSFHGRTDTACRHAIDWSLCWDGVSLGLKGCSSSDRRYGLYAHSMKVGELEANAKAASGLSVRSLAARAQIARSTITRIQAGIVDPRCAARSEFLGRQGSNWRSGFVVGTVRLAAGSVTSLERGGIARERFVWTWSGGGVSSINSLCTRNRYPKRSTALLRRQGSRSWCATRVAWASQKQQSKPFARHICLEKSDPYLADHIRRIVSLSTTLGRPVLLGIICD